MCGAGSPLFHKFSGLVRMEVGGHSFVDSWSLVDRKQSSYYCIHFLGDRCRYVDRHYLSMPGLGERLTCRWIGGGIAELWKREKEPLTAVNAQVRDKQKKFLKRSGSLNWSKNGSCTPRAWQASRHCGRINIGLVWFHPAFVQPISLCRLRCFNMRCCRRHGFTCQQSSYWQFFSSLTGFGACGTSIWSAWSFSLPAWFSLRCKTALPLGTFGFSAFKAYLPSGLFSIR